MAAASARARRSGAAPAAAAPSRLTGFAALGEPAVAAPGPEASGAATTPAGPSSRTYLQAARPAAAPAPAAASSGGLAGVAEEHPHPYDRQ